MVSPGADVLVRCWDAFRAKASFRYCFNSSVGVNISQLLPLRHLLTLGELLGDALLVFVQKLGVEL